MATSFISFKKESICLRDDFTEICINYLLQEIETKIKPVPNWLNDMATWWKLIRTGCISTCMTLKFDEYLIDQDRIKLMNNLIEGAIAELLKKGEYLSVEALNTFVFDPKVQNYYVEPLATNRIIKTLEIFQRLINEEEIKTFEHP